MPVYDFDWMDAFSTTPFAGNGCVVVHGADDIPTDQRLALVRETSLSECAFLVSSDQADFGARYYLATREIPIAGHPTIATVASLQSRGLLAKSPFTLELGGGVITIETDGNLITMRQPKPDFLTEEDPSEIAAIYGLSPRDIIGTPKIVSFGTPFCCTLLSSRRALDAAVLDAPRLEAWRADRASLLGDTAGVMEPFLSVREGGGEGDIYSRLLLAPPLPAEDPYTGSANGCMAAYLWSEGYIDTPVYQADQGHGMGRPGTARMEVFGPPDGITGMGLTGRAYKVMSGQLHL